MRGASVRARRSTPLTGGAPPFAGRLSRRSCELRILHSEAGDDAGGRSTMSTTRERGWGSAGRLVIGIYLLGLGVLLLMDNLGYDIPGELWSYWPFLLVGLGLVKLIWPDSSEERAGGFWLLTSGLYALISTWHLFGLRWGSAWPIFLVAGGVSIVFRDFGCKAKPARSASHAG
jgi:hypothetical protein